MQRKELDLLCTIASSATIIGASDPEFRDAIGARVLGVLPSLVLYRSNSKLYRTAANSLVEMNGQVSRKMRAGK